MTSELGKPQMHGRKETRRALRRQMVKVLERAGEECGDSAGLTAGWLKTEKGGEEVR